MLGTPHWRLRTHWLAIWLLAGMAGGHAAEKSAQAISEGKSDARLGSIQAALAKVDLNFKTVVDSSFAFDSDDLSITIKADKAVFYKGEPFQNSVRNSASTVQCMCPTSF